MRQWQGVVYKWTFGELINDVMTWKEVTENGLTKKQVVERLKANTDGKVMEIGHRKWVVVGRTPPRQPGHMWGYHHRTYYDLSESRNGILRLLNLKTKEQWFEIFDATLFPGGFTKKYYRNPYYAYAYMKGKHRNKRIGEAFFKAMEEYNKTLYVYNLFEGERKWHENMKKNQRKDSSPRSPLPRKLAEAYETRSLSRSTK